MKKNGRNFQNCEKFSLLDFCKIVILAFVKAFQA